MENYFYKEKNRLESLIRYDILNNTPDEELDNVTKLTAEFFNIPSSIIAFMDDKTSWFKSAYGTSELKIDKELSFCYTTIQRYDVLEIPDTLLNPMCCNNPFVFGEPKIRYYMGAPLTTPDGYNIGTISVIDFKPRKFSSIHKRILKLLSNYVINYLELKIKNKEIEVLNEKNQILTRAKEEFLSNISHEIRTPINAIYGFTQILSNSYLDSEQSNNLKIIKNSVENLISLINDLLDFSKMESGKFKIEKYSFNVKSTLDNLYQMFQPNLNNKNISFIFNVDEKIPHNLIGDGVRLNQILINLVSNSLKFTEKGSVLCNVNVIEDNYDEITLKFSVKDTGIGIPEDKINRIFDRFNQIHSDNFKKFGGTGLGLCIAKNLIELQGGKISVNSIYGKGTEFSFILKYNKNENVNINLYDLSEAKKKCQNIRVLICEDSELNIKLIKTILENWHMEVVIAENGKKGIEILEKEIFDLILMDLNMPEMNGFDTTTYIKNNLKLEIPIVAFTANNSNIEKEYCKSLGMNHYITKPFKHEELYSIISNIIDNHIIKNDKPKNQKFSKKHLNKALIKSDYKNIIHENELISIKVLKEFTGNDDDFENEIIDEFLKQIPVYLDNFENEILNKNYDNIFKLAHKMKSSVQMFGSKILFEKLESIQTICTDYKNLITINKLFSELIKSSDLLRIELNKYSNIIIKNKLYL